MATMTDDAAKANIAANVTRFRGDRTRAWLAEASGTYTINISRIERGESMPSAGLLKRIADVLEVSTDQLFAPPFQTPDESAPEKKRKRA